MRNVTIRRIFAGIVWCFVTLSSPSASEWASSPKPKYPAQALKLASEGAVQLQVILNPDGTVKGSVVTKSSGDILLDRAAQSAVARWKMKVSAIRPNYLTKGRETLVEFKQEAVLAARYSDRTAYFDSWEKTDHLMYAPFPSYPLAERELHHQGVVWLLGETARDGTVKNVKVLQSSGYPALDNAALAALRLWRVHKQFGGERFKIPIRFVMGQMSRGGGMVRTIH